MQFDNWQVQHPTLYCRNVEHIFHVVYHCCNWCNFLFICPQSYDLITIIRSTLLKMHCTLHSQYSQCVLYYFYLTGERWVLKKEFTFDFFFKQTINYIMTWNFILHNFRLILRHVPPSFLIWNCSLILILQGSPYRWPSYTAQSEPHWRTIS